MQTLRTEPQTVTRACGCSTKIDAEAVIYTACPDKDHEKRLQLFWRVVARARGLTFGFEVPTRRVSARARICGCAWLLSDGVLVVMPCETEHHAAALMALSQEYCEREALPIECILGDRDG